MAEHQCDCSVSLQAFAVDSFKHGAIPSWPGRYKASPAHKEESLSEWVDSVFHLILIIVPFIPLQNFGSSAWSGFASEILGDW